MNHRLLEKEKAGMQYVHRVKPVFTDMYLHRKLIDVGEKVWIFDGNVYQRQLCKIWGLCLQL